MGKKRTKAQKKRLILAIDAKACALFTEGVMSVNDYSKIQSMCAKALVKIGYPRSDLMG